MADDVRITFGEISSARNADGATTAAKNTMLPSSRLQAISDSTAKSAIPIVVPRICLFPER